MPVRLKNIAYSDFASLLWLSSMCVKLSTRGKKENAKHRRHLVIYLSIYFLVKWSNAKYYLNARLSEMLFRNLLYDSSQEQERGNGGSMNVLCKAFI